MGPDRSANVDGVSRLPVVDGPGQKPATACDPRGTNWPQEETDARRSPRVVPLDRTRSIMAAGPRAPHRHTVGISAPGYGRSVRCRRATRHDGTETMSEDL